MDRLKIWEWVSIVVLGTVCGLAGYLNRASDSGEKIRKSQLIIQTLSAAVSGCIVLLICTHYELDMVVTGIITGASGWMGGAATLNLITNQVRSKLGLDGKGGEKNED